MNQIRNKHKLTYGQFMELTGLAPCNYTLASLAQIYWREGWTVDETIRFFKVPWYRHVQWARKLFRQNHILFT